LNSFSAFEPYRPETKKNQHGCPYIFAENPKTVLNTEKAVATNAMNAYCLLKSMKKC
jgi:hypothetical protein